MYVNTFLYIHKDGKVDFASQFSGITLNREQMTVLESFVKSK